MFTRLRMDVVEDVLVKVREFIYSVNFAALSTKRVHDECHIPMILGCPFLAPSKPLLTT